MHPGGANNQADINFVKAKIAAGAEPWRTKFNNMLGLATAYTATTAPQDGAEEAQKQDALKAYANALAYAYTGNTTYAQNAINVLNTWGRTFNGYAVPAPGQGNQSQLNAGWISSLLGPAAELMRGYAGWSAADRTMVQNMFKTKFYPALNQMSTWNGNVDLAQIDGMLNLAVFNEDKAELDLGIQRLNARIPRYFYLTGDTGVNYGDWFNPTKFVDGLTQETCRDNDHHSQFAMASLFSAAEVLWNQGVDVYGQNAKRFTAVLELMSQQVITGSMQGTCANNTTVSTLFDTYAIGYNHYHNRKGLALPFTEQVMNSTRNKASSWNIFYESLTHGGLPAGNASSVASSVVRSSVPSSSSVAPLSSSKSSVSSIAPSSSSKSSVIIVPPSSSSSVVSSSVRSSSVVSSTPRSSIGSSSSVGSGFGNWQLDTVNSYVNFVTTKNYHVIEAQKFDTISGSMNDAGVATLTVDLASVNTANTLRDQRIRDLFFETATYPTATVTTTLDTKLLSSMAVGASSAVTIAANLNLHGVVVPVSTKVMVQKLSATKVMVHSLAPVVVKASNHTMDAGVEALRAIVGIVSVSSAAPVDFVLVFNAK